MDKIILYSIIIFLFSCDDKATEPVSTINPIEVILQKGEFYNLTTALSDTISTSSWHISLKYENVECAGIEAPMYFIEINENVNALLINGSTYSDISSYSNYYPDYLIENESVEFGAQNEIIHYSGCDDGFLTHILSLNNPNSIYTLHDIISNTYFKLQFVDFLSPAILFKYNILQ